MYFEIIVDLVCTKYEIYVFIKITCLMFCLITFVSWQLKKNLSLVITDIFHWRNELFCIYHFTENNQSKRNGSPQEEYRSSDPSPVNFAVFLWNYIKIHSKIWFGAVNFYFFISRTEMVTSSLFFLSPSYWPCNYIDLQWKY